MANVIAENTGLDELLKQAKEQERAKFFAQCAGAITAESEHLRSTGQAEAAAQWKTIAADWALASRWVFAQIDERIDGNPPRDEDYWLAHVEAISEVSRVHLQKHYETSFVSAAKATGQCQFSELDQQLGVFLRQAVNNEAADADAGLDELLEQAKQLERAKFYAQCSGALRAQAEFFTSKNVTDTPEPIVSSANSYELASRWVFAQIDERIDGNEPREENYWVAHVDDISEAAYIHQLGVLNQVSVVSSVKATAECRELNELDKQLGVFLRQAVSKGEIVR